MNSRDLGADLVLAWSSAELGIMSARAAVGIVNRRELRLASDPESERSRPPGVYASEHLHAEAAAAEGLVVPAVISVRVEGVMDTGANSAGDGGP